jgi:hypothetical protein
VNVAVRSSLTKLKLRPDEDIVPVEPCQIIVSGG